MLKVCFVVFVLEVCKIQNVILYETMGASLLSALLRLKSLLKCMEPFLVPMLKHPVQVLVLLGIKGGVCVSEL